MRITCPNCSAQYDIAEDMVPDDGRDVQCSNCGTTWFQAGRSRTATAAGDRAARQDQTPAPDAGTVRKAPHLVEPDEPDEPDVAPTAAPAPGRRRRAIPDEKTLEILREEREHETRQRSSRTPNVPNDLSVLNSAAEAAARRRGAAERARLGAAAARGRVGDEASAAAPQEPEIDVSDVVAATLRAAQDDAPTARDTYDGKTAPATTPQRQVPRRELLPDIEEINSSLRPDERAAEMSPHDEVAQDGDTDIRRRSGFRTGFLIVVALFVIASGVYIFAAPIKESVPALTGMLDAYVAWVDAKRLMLATAVENLTDRLTEE